MRVLTVRQPWAAAMFAELIRDRKDIENRTWQPLARGRIAIHAAQRVDLAAARLLGVDTPDRDLGVVLGTVEVVRWHEAPDECWGEGCLSIDDAEPISPWAQFPKPGDAPLFHWVLRGPRRFVTPIRASGQLGLWEPGPTLAAQIRDAEVLP